MFSDSREEVRRALFREIEGEGFQAIFESIREEASPLGRFTTPADLITFLHQADASAYEEKDAILYGLIRRSYAHGDVGSGARLLLLAAMSPALEHSYFRLFSLLSAEQDPFAEVYWAFLEEVRNWNPDKRDRIAANLQRRAEKRVRASVELERRYQKARRAVAREGEAYGPRVSAALAADADWPTEADRDDAEAALAEFAARGVITEAQRRIVLAHTLKGQTLRQIAEEMGSRAQAVERRYERAVWKIRKALGKKK